MDMRQKNQKSLFFLLIVALSAFLFKDRARTSNQDSDLYKIEVQGHLEPLNWSDFEGRYPIIAITDKKHYESVEQLAIKLNEHFSTLSKGIFFLDYSGQEQDFFMTLQGQDRCWGLRNFDGSIFALYPFTRIPAYYYIDEALTAHGPFYKRKEIIQALVKEEKNKG